MSMLEKGHRLQVLGWRRTAKALALLLFVLSTIFYLLIPVAADAATIGRPQNNLGLVGYWGFDVGKGGSVVYDQSGRGNTGTLTNATNTSNWQDGVIGQAIQLDGDNDYVNIPETGSLKPNTFTVSLWAKRDTDCDPTYSALFKGAGGSGYGSGFLLHCNNTNLASIRWGDGSNPDGGIAAGALTLDEWEHVVGTYDGTTMRIYLNGALGNEDSSVNFGYVSGAAQIGASNGVPNFDGHIDDVRMYNRALSAAEVARLYKLGIAGGQKIGVFTTANLTENLVGHWSFDNIIDNMIVDETGNARQGFIADYVIMRGESTTDWFDTAPNNMNISASTVDVRDPNTGTGSVLLEDQVGSDSHAYYNPSGTWDFSNSDEIIFWTKAEDSGAGTGGEFYLFNESFTAWMQWNFTYPSDWEAIRIDLSSPDATSGSLDLSATGVMRFDTNLLGGDFYIDEVVAYSAVEFVTGKDGSALHFDGVNDQVEFGDPDAFEGTGSHTMAAWVNPDEIPESAQYFFIKGDDTLTGGWGMGLSIESDAKWSVDVITTVPSTVGYEAVSSASSVVAGEWAHVAGVFDDSEDTVTLYVNGILTDVTNTGSTLRHADNSHLGTNAGLSSFFAGSLDDVRLYDRALSEEEVRRLYQGGSASTINSSFKNRITDGLVGHWTFDGDVTNTTNTFDLSGNGNHGTLTNGPQPTVGKLGQALEFDGDNDFVDYGDILDFGASTDFSVSLWFKRDNLDDTITLIAKRQSGSPGTRQGWALRAQSSGLRIRLIMDDDLANNINDNSYGTATHDINTWYHLAALFDRDGQSIAYLNGQYIGTIDISGIGNISNSQNFVVGTISDNAAGQTDGLIDDVRLYNRILSADEVRALYNMGQ